MNEVERGTFLAIFSIIGTILTTMCITVAACFDTWKPVECEGVHTAVLVALIPLVPLTALSICELFMNIRDRRIEKEVEQ